MNEPQNWGTYNLVYYNGTDKTYIVRYKVGGVNKDLTNFTATFYLYLENGTTLSRTVGSGIVIGNTAGTITITLSASFMSAVPQGSHTYYLEMVAPTGEQTPVIEGGFVVEGA